MDFLSDLLKNFLGGAALKALSKKTGIGVRDLKKFVPQALEYLVKMLTKNASSEEGASSLLTALTQHANDEPVDKQIADADIVDGGKIIGHILGGGLSENLKSLAKQFNLSETAVSGILSSIAPALLSSLAGAVFGNSKKTTSKKPSGILGLLSGLFGGGKSKSKSKSKSKKEDDEFDGAKLISALLSKK
jgi:hypothetical protein